MRLITSNENEWISCCRNTDYTISLRSFFAFAFWTRARSKHFEVILFFLLLENEMNWIDLQKIIEKILNYMSLIFRCGLSIKLLWNLTIQLHNFFSNPIEHHNWNVFCCNWKDIQETLIGNFTLILYSIQFKWFVFDEHFTWKWLNTSRTLNRLSHSWRKSYVQPQTNDKCTYMIQMAFKWF